MLRNTLLFLFLLQFPADMKSYMPLPGDYSMKMKAYVNPQQEILDALTASGLGESVAYLIIAQAQLESGHFSSRVYQENCNPFGMKEARVRKNTALGTHRGHALYQNLKEATQDFILWMRYAGIPAHISHPEEYICYLESARYFQCSSEQYKKTLFALYYSLRPTNVYIHS